MDDLPHSHQDVDDFAQEDIALLGGGAERLEELLIPQRGAL